MPFTLVNWQLTASVSWRDPRKSMGQAACVVLERNRFQKTFNLVPLLLSLQRSTCYAHLWSQCWEGRGRKMATLRLAWPPLKTLSQKEKTKPEALLEPSSLFMLVEAAASEPFPVTFPSVPDHASGACLPSDLGLRLEKLGRPRGRAWAGTRYVRSRDYALFNYRISIWVSVHTSQSMWSSTSFLPSLHSLGPLGPS